jgi:hypothetical protein
MADILCPQCGKPNPDKLEKCQFCGATLQPPGSPWSVRPGEEPVKKNTAEFEKVSVPPSDKEPIHPGEAPTKKNTAELERALPSWLRSLRQKDETAGDITPAQPPERETPPPAPEEAPAPGPSEEGLPDWLAGLGSAASDEEEEIPDWLTALRGKGEEPRAPQVGSAAGLGAPEWVSPPGGETQPPTPEAVQEPPAETQPTTFGDIGLPDWLEKMQARGSAAGTESPSTQRGNEETPGWLSNLPEEPAVSQANPPEETPDWLNRLNEKAPGPEPVSPLSTPAPAESAPPWLSNLETGQGPQAAAPAEETPDWLNKLNEQAPGQEANLPPTPSADITPDWLANIQPEAEQAAATPAGEIPDWLSKLQTQAGSDTNVPVPSALAGEPSGTGSAPAAESPNWLAKLQADAGVTPEAEAGKEEFEVTSEPPSPQPASEALPEWLSGIDQTATPSTGTPALIVDNEENASAGQTQAAFSMETPDWLAKLNPEQGEARPRAVSGEEGQSPDSLQPANLPSWVQAMRPVEAVVEEAKATPLEENQVTEDRGPLAGLTAVLPAGPGLGPLRKPPAYSVKLQATDSQQRYATYLEKLVSSEVETRTRKAARIKPGSLLRWIIAAVLILAVGLPIMTGLQVTPAAALYPPEMAAMFSLVGGLPAHSPVLVVFDYEPALSGELEAAAAPVIGQLLLNGARLTIISTSPTGPALAKRFIDNTLPGQNNQSGDQIVNLGYLAGGPAGVLYFANSPAEAAPFTVDGLSAWKTTQTPALPPLADVRYLGDFKAVLVLTDSADTARVWIEQAGPFLGNTPMAMAISAQAEPMIRPYFDSGQIRGLVTGLAGGKAYEQDVQQNYGLATQPAGLGQNYWNAFSAGLLVAEGLIVVGGLWSLLGGRVSRKTKTGEKA